MQTTHYYCYYCYAVIFCARGSFKILGNYNGDYRNGILEVCYHIWAYWIFRYDSYQ